MTSEMVRQRNSDAARMRENRAQRMPANTRFASSAVVGGDRAPPAPVPAAREHATV